MSYPDFMDMNTGNDGIKVQLWTDMLLMVQNGCNTITVAQFVTLKLERNFA